MADITRKIIYRINKQTLLESYPNVTTDDDLALIPILTKLLVEDNIKARVSVVVYPYWEGINFAGLVLELVKPMFYVFDAYKRKVGNSDKEELVQMVEVGGEYGVEISTLYNNPDKDEFKLRVISSEAILNTIVIPFNSI